MVKDILPHLFPCDGHRHGCSFVLTELEEGDEIPANDEIDN